MSATNRGSIRKESDFYPTPKSAFRPLLPFLPKVPIWEPANGDGRLCKWMCEIGLKANGDDLNSGYNFLSDMLRRFCIVTNPPFSIAQEFVEHSLSISAHTFMLLRINFLASKRRKEFWINNEPSALFVLSERPSFTGNGTDATDYAWFYWGKLHKGIYHL